MSLDPPMPVYLYNQVAGLRERNAKGYPVKKVSRRTWHEGRKNRLTDPSCLWRSALAAALEVFTLHAWRHEGRRACQGARPRGRGSPR